MLRFYNFFKVKGKKEDFCCSIAATSKKEALLIYRSRIDSAGQYHDEFEDCGELVDF